MPGDDLMMNDYAVDGLVHSLVDGKNGLSDVPICLTGVLRSGAWRDRKVRRLGGKRVRFDTFEEFVTTPPLEGLGVDVGLIRRIVGEKNEVRDLLDQEFQHPNGQHHAVDNVNSSGRRSGNAAEQALRRLRKDRPDIHARVVAEELSPHAGMIEAGFRKRTITVPCDPGLAAAALRRHLTAEQLAELRELI